MKQIAKTFWIKSCTIAVQFLKRRPDIYLAKYFPNRHGKKQNAFQGFWSQPGDFFLFLLVDLFKYPERKGISWRFCYHLLGVKTDKSGSLSSFQFSSYCIFFNFWFRCFRFLKNDLLIDDCCPSLSGDVFMRDEIVHSWRTIQKHFFVVAILSYSNLDQIFHSIRAHRSIVASNLSLSNVNPLFRSDWINMTHPCFFLQTIVFFFDPWHFSVDLNSRIVYSSALVCTLLLRKRCWILDSQIYILDSLEILRQLGLQRFEY